MSAHPLSLSRSKLEIQEGLVRLTVSMPILETEHLPVAERNLGRYFRIDGQGPVSSSCSTEDADLVCRTVFLTGTARVVESDLAPAVLPHHIHTLHVGGRVYTFTALQRSHELDTPPPQFPWWTLLGIALAAFVAIRSLRSRRRSLRPS